ncbi:hypothetical protein [Kitasatospora kifunensis]|uniref:Uncharacterized protein n=1 Tax=Kitasatospora kifunensis TaxID=58351 RepID=A0A7W7VTD9_KITKI|nr:hypothetical protein [Kitasatospora kifunensis]MBB4922201.1 hypothetical protein [Kitasatospora kifunensis]
MGHRKFWTGRIIGIGYRSAINPITNAPKVGVDVEVTDGPQTGRRIDIRLTPQQARSWAESLINAADHVEDEIKRNCIASDAAKFEAERLAKI